jgi:hypothetical protein
MSAALAAFTGLKPGGVNEASMNDVTFAIEVNRASIVQRIVRFFDEEIRAAGMTPEMAREQLSALRVDQLLAASLSNRFADVLNIVAEPTSSGTPSHRFVSVSPVATAGYAPPAEASLFVVRSKDRLDIAPASALSALPAGSQVVGFFTSMAGSTAVVAASSGGVSRRMDGSGTGANSWIGYTAGGNVASGSGSAVAAGQNNTASGQSSFVAAGFANQANGISSLVIGGFDNRATNTDAMVGAGAGNRATGARSVIVGGGYNLASGNFSFIGGGGRDGTISTAAGPALADHIAQGKWSTIGGGAGNRAYGLGSTVAGGYQNKAGVNPTCAESVFGRREFNDLPQESALHGLARFKRPRAVLIRRSRPRASGSVSAARCRADRAARPAPRQAA